MSRIVDMTGETYGSVVALGVVGKCKSGDLKWRFLCQCGQEFDASGYAIRSGKVKDCPKCAAARSATASVVHGKTNTPEFEIWVGIHTRCYNSKRPEYPDYGGRGIVICDRWLASFESFLSDMGPRPSKDHSIERINNDGNYEPGNCRWATRLEQARNKRSNVLVTLGGDTKLISEWARLKGVQVGTACLRYKNGLRGEDLFKTSVKQISYQGITDTITGWSVRTGIKRSALAMRLNRYNWPIEKALTKGGKS